MEISLLLVAPGANYLYQPSYSNMGPTAIPQYSAIPAELEFIRFPAVPQIPNAAITTS